MILKKIPSNFKKYLKVVSSTANRLGFKIYLVGGVVRDLILGRENIDLDVVVEGEAISLAKELARHFNREFNKHHKFGTATIEFPDFKIDFATARRERYPHWGSLPYVEPASLEEDLFRRDFTINALAVSLNISNYGEIIDFYGGLKDIKNGLIRVLHRNSFLDDPTRILRAIRFEQRFSFKIEKETFTLLKKAVNRGALSFVHPHRIRDEIILILREENPPLCIKRIDKLVGFTFLDKRLRLNGTNFTLISSIKKVNNFYNIYFIRHRKLKEWIIYLAAILINLPLKNILKFLDKFGFKKGERLIIASIKRGISKIKKLSSPVNSSGIYRILNPFSFEAIIFFYAYYSDRTIRKRIKDFLDNLINIRIKVRGEDLKRIGLKPSYLYGKILNRLLYKKIDKNLTTKEEELDEAKRIYKRLIKRDVYRLS